MNTRNSQSLHQHQEAFCHMRYRSDNGQDEVSIWNSRDGVTPFVITIPGTDKQGKHIEWHLDRYDPDYKPKEGDWIFVDLTPERAREAAKRNAAHYWDNNIADAQRLYKSVEDIERILYTGYTDRPGAPDLIQVEEPWE